MSLTWNITESGSLIIRQNSSINLRALHKALFQWAEENNYFFNEKNFTEKVKSHGHEFDIEWNFRREVTPFIRFHINIALWVGGANPVEKNGEKLMQGRLEGILDSKMEMDWQNRWDTSPFLRFLRRIYIYYLKKQYFLNYAGKCWEDTYSLHALIKSHLNQFSLF